MSGDAGRWGEGELCILLEPGQTVADIPPGIAPGTRILVKV